MKKKGFLDYLLSKFCKGEEEKGLPEMQKGKKEKEKKPGFAICRVFRFDLFQTGERKHAVATRKLKCQRADCVLGFAFLLTLGILINGKANRK